MASEKSKRWYVKKAFADYLEDRERIVTFEEFKEVRDILREAGVELYKPIDKAATEVCISFQFLKNLFGSLIYANLLYLATDDESSDDESEPTGRDEERINGIIKEITNEDLENFRLQILKIYRIKYCNCGCTALMLDSDLGDMSIIRWARMHHCAAMMICAEKETIQR